MHGEGKQPGRRDEEDDEKSDHAAGKTALADAPAVAAPTDSLAGLLGGYGSPGSDSDSDDSDD